MMVSCEKGNENSEYIECGEFLHLLNRYSFLKQESNLLSCYSLLMTTYTVWCLYAIREVLVV
jgi:hypothetical protein